MEELFRNYWYCQGPISMRGVLGKKLYHTMPGVMAEIIPLGHFKRCSHVRHDLHHLQWGIQSLHLRRRPPKLLHRVWKLVCNYLTIDTP